MAHVKGSFVGKGRTRPRVSTPELHRWWKAYLDRTLDRAQLVTLAAAVKARAEGKSVSPLLDQQADAAWSLVWGRAHGQDLVNLGVMWGPQADWSQLVGS